MEVKENMRKIKKKLVLRRKKLLKKLDKAGPFIEGSLAVTPRMCGIAGCVCHRGKKHSAMYLTWKEDQKTKSLYIPVERQKEALAMNRNYKKVKKIIKSLSELHKKMLVD
jgi:hypothetical protein